MFHLADLTRAILDSAGLTCDGRVAVAVAVIAGAQLGDSDAMARLCTGLALDSAGQQGSKRGSGRCLSGCEAARQRKKAPGLGAACRVMVVAATTWLRCRLAGGGQRAGSC